jgi:excisionase family DNA binding protein
MLNDPVRDMEAFLTTEEVLGYLKITPRTIYRLIRSGELPAVRIGRQWRFRRGDLDRWLERQRAFSGSPL